MHAAVAVLTLGDVGISRGRGLGVYAVVIGGLLIGMTGGAGRLGRCGIVRERLDVGVAIGAAKNAVDRRFELGIVDVQADLLAVFFLNEGRVAMASQALVVAHLGGFGRRGRVLLGSGSRLGRGC